jgi:FkbM family methyltransferase
MKELLLKSGIEFDEEGFIKIPEWVKRVKIDVGLSENAPQSQRWIEREKDLLVFGFEPNPMNLEKIKARNSEWSVTLHPKFIGQRIFLIECALSNVQEMEQMEFYCTSDDPGCSSLLKPKEFAVGGVVQVQTWSLNHFLSYFPFHKIPYIEFIKTDCQGVDIDVVKGCSKFLGRVAVFTCEADDTRYHKSKNTIDALDEIFIKNGFIRYKKFMKNLTKFIGPRLKYIETEDPTYINQRLRKQIQENKIRAFQEG